MKSKTIYVFSNSYKPVLGGIQTVASQFAEECKDRGIRTIVIANLYPKRLKIYEKISNIPVIRLPFAIPNGHLKNGLFVRYFCVCIISTISVSSPQVRICSLPIVTVIMFVCTTPNIRFQDNYLLSWS